jgi:ligand-binding sensor domain-containing protein
MKTKILVQILMFCLASHLYGQVWKQYETNSVNNNCMFEDSEGKLWFYSNYMNRAGALTLFDGTTATSYKKLNNTRVTYVPSITEANGKLYIGTPFGLMEKEKGVWKTLKKDDGLPGKQIMNLYTDIEGNLWVFNVAVMKGVFGIYRNRQFTPIPMKGHSGRAVISVAQDLDKNVWTGTHLGKVAMFDGEKWADFSKQVKGKHIKAFAVDSKGAVWMAGIEGYFAKYEKGRWNEFKYGSGYFCWDGAAAVMAFGILPGVIMGYAAPDFSSFGDVLVDKSDKAWVLARRHGVAISDGIKFDDVETKTLSPKTDKVVDILIDKDDNIWLADKKGKVYYYNYNTWKTYTQADGLPKSISGIYQDSKGNIWVSGKKAIAVLRQ